MREPRLIDEAFVNTLIRKRAGGLHKGDCGKVLVIAGKMGMAGAAILCARGALHSGAGLVRISAPQEIWPILQTAVPEATCVSRALSPDMLNEHQAVAMGPGIGADETNEELVKTVIEQYAGPLVLDADGLNLLATHPEWIGLRKGEWILTPHSGEAGRLLGLTAERVNGDRQGTVRELAEKYRATAVLKGAGTLVARPDGAAYINSTGNPGMATGGSGDVLTGITASLTGQGLSCDMAAVAAVYLHGLAGDLAAEALGEYGMTSADVASMTALAFKKMLMREPQ